MNVAKRIQLKPDEEVLMIVHASLIPLWPKVFLAFVWLTLPFFLLFPLFHMQWFGAGVFFLLLVSGMCYAYRAFVMWYESVFFVTDGRIIDIDQSGLFHRVVSEAGHAQIRDVAYEIHGFWATILRYGDVTMHIRGSQVDLEIFHVRHPAKVHDLINDLRTDSHNDHVKANDLHP